MENKIVVEGKVIKMERTDTKEEYRPEGFDYIATIELSLRELLEQLTHKEVNELLEMINLPPPHPEAKKEIEELSVFSLPYGNENWCRMIEDRITKLIKDVNLLNDMMGGKDV